MYLFPTFQHHCHGLALDVVAIKLTLVICESAKEHLLILVWELNLHICLQSTQHVRIDCVTQNASTSGHGSKDNKKQIIMNYNEKDHDMCI